MPSEVRPERLSGCHWSVFPTDELRSPQETQFFSASVGLSLDEQCLLHTEDGGVSWRARNCDFGVDDFEPEDLYFADSRVGWVVGGEGIAATSNGGQAWTIKSVAKGVVLMGVDFFDRSRGYAVGYATSMAGTTRGVGFRTDDGGANWQEMHIPALAVLSWRVLDVMAISKDGVVIVGDSTVATSTDGGRSWGKLSISDETSADGVHERLHRGFGDTIWIEDELPIKQVIVSHDLGKTWTAMPSPGPEFRGELAVISPHLTFAANGKILYATDGKKTWNTAFDMTSVNESFWKIEFRAQGGLIVAYGEQFSVRCELGQFPILGR